ncbi:MAG: hypothetical protein GXP41_10375 [Chloroflexi bacterium]|nr:hypothetical protein [Chloroflexota bacterium]
MNCRFQRLLLAGLFCLAVTGPAQAVLAGGPVFQVRDTVAQQSARPLYVPGQLLVRFRPTVPAKTRQDLLAGHDMTVIRALLLPDVYLVQADGHTPAPEMAKTLRQEPSVVTAEPNYYRYAAFIPNDPYYGYQWNFPMISRHGTARRVPA